MQVLEGTSPLKTKSMLNSTLVDIIVEVGVELGNVLATSRGPRDGHHMHRTTPGDVADFQPISGLEIISDTQNQRTLRSCSSSSACKKIRGC